ncbi:alpha/beta fold hydrolase [Actinomadura sp. WAC 06369]|uniref:alpha/beta fold hydrolase n=1 Tax=Actinomadura sp. WAC 06369 TaxID=2203193 RepID=UPI000F7B07A0|nr:alpha/beta hydrolase [Actinomadura sp. WAC 06369]RSN44542.1 alpha/beta hydrolase [Actinomadura sp. WAC 06369]
MRTDTLRVPGATLYYEVRGSGPVLVLVCGGIYDAEGYAALADALADRYTVVTYDRRGNSRSPLDDPSVLQSVDDHAADAGRIAAAVAGGEPVHVFGNSSGAVIALEFALRHPRRAASVVAHEPPYLGLLPDDEDWPGVLREVAAAFREGGVGPAMGRFGAAMQAGGEAPAQERDEGPAPDPETMARFAANTAVFVGAEMPVFGLHLTDFGALRAHRDRIVLAVGAGSAGQPPERAARAAAGRLGVEPAVWPGDHGGFGPHAAAFADRLHAVFSAHPRGSSLIQ